MKRVIVYSAITALVLAGVAPGAHATPLRDPAPAAAPQQRWDAAGARSPVDPKAVNRHLPKSLRGTYPLHKNPDPPRVMNTAQTAEAPVSTAAVPVGSTKPNAAMYVHGGNSAAGGDELRVGRLNGEAAASYLRFDLDHLRFHTIYGVQLQVVNYDSASCTPKALAVHPVTQSWSPGSGYSYPGPSVGGAIASNSFAHGHIATGQSASACPATSRLIDLGVAGRDLVQRWVNGDQANHGLSLRASATDSGAWKKIAGAATANPPKLFITHSPHNASYSIPKPVPDPPVLQNQAGKVKVTVTNKSATAWAPGDHYLAYRVYRADTGAPAGQQRAAGLTATVARGASVTLDATIQPMPPGRYFLDFTMVRTGGVVFTDHQVPPGRIVLQVFDIPPVVEELHPPNGYQTPTLTPQLWARALDVDAPPGSALRFKFEVCERDQAGKPVSCFDSGYLTTTAWAVPAGKLVWSRAYLWRVFVKDGTSEVTSPRSALLTSVPQPEITSRIAGAPYGAQEREFDAQIGNYTTAALDAPVVTAGPDLNVLRTYNSLDPRRDGLFGAGWVTRYDMRVKPDDDGSGNVVVSYPDGQEVRFGRNPDGTYAAPEGRTAALTLESSAWRLRDKSGTVYLFSAAGRLTRITDAAGRAVVLTYGTDGRLARAQVANSQSNQAGRSLRFTWTGNHIGSVSSDPVGGVTATWTYTYTGDLLTKVCAPGNACTSYEYTAGSHYRTAVADARPESYWRLGEAQGAFAASEVAVNLGKDAATYRNTTLGTAGAIAGGGTAATFNGTSAAVELPKGAVKKSRDLAVELWFKVAATGTGGPLLGYQDKATSPVTGVPVLYVGTDGRLRGQFATGTVNPVTSGRTVNDGQWHHVVLSNQGSTQTLYLDGVRAGELTGQTVEHSLLTFNQVGSATATGTWPAWGTAAQRFFAGVIDEVAIYAHPLGPGAVADHHRYGTTQADQLAKVTLPSGKVAAEQKYDAGLDRLKEHTDRHGGTWKIGAPAVFGGDDDLRRSILVLDPGNRPHLFEYDALAGRLLRSGLPAGLETREEDRPGDPVTPPEPPEPVCSAPDPGDPRFCTIIPDGASGPVFVRHPLEGMSIRSYEYDERGFQKVVRNENGDTVTMAYDDRGNVTARTTCRTNTQCQTAYTSYRAAVTDPFDPTNDLPTESRDARSSGPADNTYRTRYTYTARGELDTQIGPDGATVRHTYTTGAEVAVGGGTMPAGLVSSTTAPGNFLTRYHYYANGDLARVVAPTGLITDYTYDALGRRTSQKETSDTFPAGVVTTYTYDQLSRLVTSTEPVTTNAVDGTKHQLRTTHHYDADGNVIRSETADLPGGETRVVTTEYDDRNRPDRVIDPEGGTTSYDYDRFGNRTSIVDGSGNRYDFAYTSRNKLAEIRLRDWQGDPPGSPATGEYIVLHAYSYDLAGRMVSDTNAMGRRLEYQYYDDDLRQSTTLKGFRNSDGTTRDYVVEANTYDAAGHLVKQVTGNSKNVTEHRYNNAGQVESTIEDPEGVARTTTFTYDLAGNVSRVKQTGRTSNVPWLPPVTEEVVDHTHDASGNPLTETVAGRTTSHTYDQRGIRLSTTDPRGAGFTTTFAADELGRPVRTIAPGNAATELQGYNAFDEPTAVKDPLGHVARLFHDRLGRVVRTEAPSYTPPGGSPVTPTTRTLYDALGNVLENIDENGNSTRYTYDRLGRVVTRDEPGRTNDQRAVWRYTYTRTDQVLSVIDPEGGRTEYTYDDLERRTTATQVERRPMLKTLTSRFAYDDANNVTSTTAPSGAKTAVVHNGVGEPIRATGPTGVATEHGYDFAGRAIRVSDGLGRTTRTDYDASGRIAIMADLAPNGQPLRGQSYVYDAAGNLTSATNALNHTTTYAYDAVDRLVRQVEPVADGKTITTSFGYDAAGNRTSYTDGRGHVTTYGYNSLGLPESVVEPATAAHPAAGDRTWTIGYTAAGDPEKLTAPGGVTRTRTFDAAGRLTRETGTGAEGPTTQRDLDHDLLGRLTKAGANTYAYNDRGQLLSANGTSGTASYVYDDDGLLTERTDAAGTSRYTYDRTRLATATDGVTGTTQRYGYDAAGEVRSVDYGAGRVRTIGYDDLGRTTSDVLRNGTQQVMAAEYGYDLDNHLMSKTTAGTAGAGANTYSYDRAGRLTGWTSGSTVTEYGWDDSGNRVRAGSRTAAFDERNRLLSDGTDSYTYTARGTLATRGAERYTFDAFDRLLSLGGQSYGYDALDRVISRNGRTFAYAGLADEVVSDGTERYARGPGDGLLAVADGPRQRLTLADDHDDVVATIDPADTGLSRPSESVAFDPFGAVVAASGDRANVGYQGDWTDQDTGRVDMGTRWYSPATGTFESRDTAQYTQGDSILANRYVYGAGAPLDHTDPDGRWPKIKCGWCGKAKQIATRAVSTTWSAVSSAASVAWSAFSATVSTAWNAVKSAASAAWNAVKTVARVAWDGIKNVAGQVWNGIKTVYNHGKAMAEQIRRAAAERARQVTAAAKRAVELAVKYNPVKIAAAALKPVMAGWKAVVSAGAHLAAKVVAVYRDVVSDVAKAAQGVYQKALDTAGAVVENVSKAAGAAADWVVAHKADIAGFAVGLAVGVGCGALIGWTGVGAVGCAALAGAAGSLVHDLVEGGHSWQEMTANALFSGALGAVTAGLGPALAPVLRPAAAGLASATRGALGSMGGRAGALAAGAGSRMGALATGAKAAITTGWQGARNTWNNRIGPVLRMDRLMARVASSERGQRAIAFVDDTGRALSDEVGQPDYQTGKLGGALDAVLRIPDGFKVPGADYMKPVAAVVISAAKHYGPMVHRASRKFFTQHLF